MRKILLSLALLGLVGSFALAAGPVGDKGGKGKGGKAEEPKKDEPQAGLVAHYFKDPTDWDGNWKAGEKPTVDPVEYTFREYKYSRVEPLINHFFIRSGWFSVRWVGKVKVEPGLASVKKDDKGDKGGKPVGTDPVDVTFEFWADDGARLFVDGVKLIDDWRACAETEPESHRKVTVKLTPGPHKIVVEYFQGESLKKQDRDPAKLYWTIPAFKIKRKIIPAAHFFHTQEDLEDYEPSTKTEEPKEEPKEEEK
jgi:hypothetical protein